MLTAQEHGSVDNHAHRPRQQRHDATLACGVHPGAQRAHGAYIQVRCALGSVHNQCYYVHILLSFCAVWLLVVKDVLVRLMLIRKARPL